MGRGCWKKLSTATRDEGREDRRGGGESQGSSCRDDRGNREKREKEGEIAERDIDDLLLAFKPSCSFHHITHRQAHFLYPAAATWTWQGPTDKTRRHFLTHIVMESTVIRWRKTLEPTEFGNGTHVMTRHCLCSTFKWLHWTQLIDKNKTDGVYFLRFVR